MQSSQKQNDQWKDKRNAWDVQRRGKGCEFASRKKNPGHVLKQRHNHKVNMPVSVKYCDSKLQIGVEITGMLASKWGIIVGKRARGGSLYFCQKQQNLKSHATSQRTSCISNQSLHKTLTWAEWKLLLRGILDLLQLRAFKSSLDFLKTRLDKCLSRLAYVVGVLWAGGKLSH